MTERRRLIKSTALGAIPVWLLAALVHVVDADVNGIAGLAAPHVLLSVTVVAAVLFLPVLLMLAAMHRRGSAGYVVTLLGVSGLIGLLLALGGSTATSFAGWIVSIGGMSLICAAAFSAASLPGVLALRRRHG